MSRPPFQRASGQQQGRGEGYRSYDPSQAEPSGRPDEAGAGTVYDEQGYPVDPALYEQQQRRYHEERQQQYGRASHDVEMVEPPMARAAPLAPPPMVRPHSWTGHQPEQMYGQRPGNVEVRIGCTLTS